MDSSLASLPSRTAGGRGKSRGDLSVARSRRWQRLLKHFDQVELRRIAKVAASVSLGTVPAAVMEPAYRGFDWPAFWDGTDLMGTLGQAEALLMGVVPEEQVARSCRRCSASRTSNFWRRLSTIPKRRWPSIFSKEHPQTIAAVASKVDPAVSARFLGFCRSSIALFF